MLSAPAAPVTENGAPPADSTPPGVIRISESPASPDAPR